MKTIAVAALIFAACCTAESAPVRPLPVGRQRLDRVQRPQPLAPAARVNRANRPAIRRTLVQDAIYGFYLKQFQQDGEFPAELIGKMLPFLEQFLQERFEIGERLARALNQSRQAIARNAPDDELNRLTREVDAANAQFESNHQKFLNNVDPLLNARQQAKVRVLQDLADKRIRQALEAVQNANPNRPAGAPPEPQK